MCKHILLFIWFIAGCSAQAVAQIHFRKLPFDWQMHIGGSYFAASGLQRVMEASQTPGVPPMGLNIALGVGYRLGKAILGVNVANGYSFGKNNQLRNTMLSAYISTNMWHVGRWTISPTVGVGPQFSVATLNMRDIVGDFEDYLAGRANQTRLNHKVTALDLGFTFKTYDLLTASYRSKFRIGYQTGLHRGTWEVGNTALANAPRDRTGTFYLQISTGIGY